MKRNTKIREGFKPNYNYPERKGVERSPFPWKFDPIGRTALILIGLISEEKHGATVEIERNFKPQGITAKFLESRLINMLPEFPAYFAAVCGKVLTDETIYHRFHKMWYANNKPREERGQRSDEHYMCNSRLRPRVPAVHDLFHRGTPISLDEARKAGL